MNNNPLVREAGRIIEKYKKGEELTPEQESLKFLPMIIQVWSVWVKHSKSQYAEDVLQDVVIEYCDKTALNKINVFHRCNYYNKKYLLKEGERYVPEKEYDEVESKSLPPGFSEYEKYEEWLWQAFFEEKSLKEIAQDQGLSYGHIRNVWSKIKREICQEN